MAETVDVSDSRTALVVDWPESRGPDVSVHYEGLPAPLRAFAQTDGAGFWMCGAAGPQGN